MRPGSHGPAAIARPVAGGIETGSNIRWFGDGPRDAVDFPQGSNLANAAITYARAHRGELRFPH
ncbi:MAG: hypothetical protein KC501_11910 [Myxococcales bacterium]|nr:hypothetical protein [Myxococcales bacterium]